MADGLLALVAAGLSLAQLQSFPSPRDRSPLNVALVLLQTLPLVFRRRAPFTVFAVVAAAAGVQGSLELRGPLFAFLALNLALYSLAAYGDRRLAIRGVAVWASLLTVRLGYVIVTRWPHVAISGLYDVVDDYVLLAAAWTLGEGVRQRRVHAAELEDRAARLEREREEKARQAAIQERLRIARELHDVVAHSLSVIGVQAGAARLVLDADPHPTRAREAVAAIEATANQAMAEMRRALGILRATEPLRGGPGPAARPGPAPRPPGPAAGGGAAGGADRDGHPAAPGHQHRPVAVPDRAGGVDQRAQARQGRPTPRWWSATAAHDITVEVTDDGRGPPPSVGTLARRRHRSGCANAWPCSAASCQVGPRPQGGYAVRVCLPTSAEEP